MAAISFESFWNEPVDGIADRVTGDPLGLRAWAGRVAAELVPGLRNGTNRVQGFGPVCAGVRRAHWQGVADSQPIPVRSVP